MPKSRYTRRVILRIALFSILIFSIGFFSIGCKKESMLLSTKTSQKIVQNFTQLKEAASMQLVKMDTSNTNKRLHYKTPVQNEHFIQKISVACVGDIMFHDIQLIKAYNSTIGEFNFSSIFTYIEPYLLQSNLTFGNLETTLNGPAGSVFASTEAAIYGYSAYPLFNSPDSVLIPIKKAGFDLISTANNHALDSSYNGLIRTIESLDKAGIKHTGTFASIEERTSYSVLETEGVRFAVINYTYSTNVLTLSGDDMSLINTLNYYKDADLEKLYADVESADNSGADYVIVMMHYGNEYFEIVDERFQRPLTQELFRRGADIVFGGHSHVLQPIEIFTQLDGVDFDEPKIAIYSLGNFLASQRNIEKMGGNTDLGVVFQVNFERFDNVKTRIAGIGFLPTYNLWQSKTIMTIPINEDYNWTGKEKPEEQTIKLPETKDVSGVGLSQWDIGRINFAKDYTISHLLQYENNKATLGPQYYSNGIYNYDLIRK